MMSIIYTKDNSCSVLEEAESTGARSYFFSNFDAAFFELIILIASGSVHFVPTDIHYPLQFLR